MATYKIKSGDTLTSIANQYGTTVNELARLNGINDVNRIYAGSTLNLPDATTTTTSAASTTPKTTATPKKTDTQAPKPYKAPTFEYDNYAPSQDVTDLKDSLADVQNQKPGEFTYDDAALNAIYEKIMNREPFSYDLNGDALYQQYKDQYTREGNLAMQNTMGQAAALTGGYGSSYAQSVGQQQYNAYLQQLNDVIPELYNAASQRYQNETSDMYNKYNLEAGKRDDTYGKYRDSVGDWQTELGYATDAYNNAKTFDYSKYSDNRSLAYNDFDANRTIGYNNYQSELDRNFTKEQSDLDYQRTLEQTKQEQALNTAMSWINSGIVPSSEMLRLAGISESDAQALAAEIKKTRLR